MIGESVNSLLGLLFGGKLEGILVLGLVVGTSVGLELLSIVGLYEGDFVGCRDVGKRVGSFVGIRVGRRLGFRDGIIVGGTDTVGATDTFCCEGELKGEEKGCCVGSLDGKLLG